MFEREPGWRQTPYYSSGSLFFNECKKTTGCRIFNATDCWSPESDAMCGTRPGCIAQQRWRDLQPGTDRKVHLSNPSPGSAHFPDLLPLCLRLLSFSSLLVCLALWEAPSPAFNLPGCWSHKGSERRCSAESLALGIAMFYSRQVDKRGGSRCSGCLAPSPHPVSRRRPMFRHPRLPRCH